MPFDPTEIEDGTGKSTALVYETIADATAWLTRRGFTAFDGQDDADQQISLINATDAAERAMRPLFRGVPRVADQALLYPASGAYSRRTGLLNEDEIPVGLLIGIRLIAEEIAGGTFMPNAGTAAWKEHGTKRAYVKYRESIDPASLEANHPDAWTHLCDALPRGL